MNFFKIWGNIIAYFSVGLLFLFSPANVSQPLLDQFAPNFAQRVVLHAIYTEASDFRKVQKPGNKGQKNIKISVKFSPRPPRFRS